MNKELMIELISTDPELLNIYHIEAPNTAEICADRTIRDLKTANSYVYTIDETGETIGYYGIERGFSIDYLTGFFIKPKYRTKERIIDFWKEVESKFEKEFYVGVYKKNTRAIKFLNKKTNEKYEATDHVFFKIKKD